jgi:hypothetical protein
MRVVEWTFSFFFLQPFVPKAPTSQQWSSVGDRGAVAANRDCLGGGEFAGVLGVVTAMARHTGGSASAVVCECTEAAGTLGVTPSIWADSRECTSHMGCTHTQAGGAPIWLSEGG